MAANLYIGKRLSFAGQLCTVRYHGEVNGTKGEWLGVEWDDPTRGKHSGENGGVKYFECKNASNLLSFFVYLRRKKALTSQAPVNSQPQHPSYAQPESPTRLARS